MSRYVFVGYNLLDKNDYIRVRDTFIGFSKYLFVPDNQDEERLLRKNIVNFTNPNLNRYFKTNSVKVFDTLSMQVIDLSIVEALGSNVTAMNPLVIKDGQVNKNVIDSLNKYGYIMVNLTGCPFPLIGQQTSHITPMFYNNKVAWDNSTGLNIHIWRSEGRSSYNDSTLDIMINLDNFSSAVLYKRRLLLSDKGINPKMLGKCLYEINDFYYNNGAKSQITALLKNMGFDVGFRDEYIAHKNNMILEITEDMNTFSIPNGIGNVYLSLRYRSSNLQIVFPPSVKNIKLMHFSPSSSSRYSYEFMFSKAIKKSVYSRIINRMTDRIRENKAKCEVRVSEY